MTVQTSQGRLPGAPRRLALAFAFLATTAAGSAADFAEQREQVLALARLTDPPKVHPADGFRPEGSLRPLFYEGLPYRGKPTRVFAWYGAPAKQKGKMPAVVRDGKPWLREVSQRRDGDRLTVEWVGTKKPDRATLWSTTDTGFTDQRKWVAAPAVLEVDGEKIRASATLPTGTRACFVNLQCGKLTASSEFEEVKP